MGFYFPLSSRRTPVLIGEQEGCGVPGCHGTHGGAGGDSKIMRVWGTASGLVQGGLVSHMQENCLSCAAFFTCSKWP